MKSWYTYKITFEDGTFYIGYRGSTKPAEKDFLIKYFSSSKKVKQKIQEDIKYIGTILSIFDNKIDAYNTEQNMIFDEITNPNILNKFCYKDRKGYGILTESAKQDISQSSRERWADPEYRTKMSNIHKERWTDELRNRQSDRLRDEFWTQERKDSHSKKLTGRAGHTRCKGVKKKEGFGAKVSAATKGIPKSESAKNNMSLSAQNRTEEHKRKISEACKNTPQKICSYCQKSFDVRNYGKYHGTKCKLSPQT